MLPLTLTKGDFEGALALLGVRSRYSKEEVELAVYEALQTFKDHVSPEAFVAECGGKRKIDRSHPESTERKRLNQYRRQLEWAEKHNRVNAQLTLYKLVKTCFRTLPKGSEVKLEWLGAPDFRNYKLKVSWRPGYYGAQGRVNLRFEPAWFAAQTQERRPHDPDDYGYG